MSKPDSVKFLADSSSCWRRDIFTFCLLSKQNDVHLYASASPTKVADLVAFASLAGYFVPQTRHHHDALEQLSLCREGGSLVDPWALAILFVPSVSTRRPVEFLQDLAA